MQQVESTNLPQRLIHGDVRTEASKEAVWRIRASNCYTPFYTVKTFPIRIERNIERIKSIIGFHRDGSLLPS